jgi:ABC-type Fe3+/spermidine/putrescine transport system ATPase subunit
MIRIDGLGYRVGTFALDGVSLEVAAGEYFVLVGPTGSGKTLFLECVCGLNRIDAGRVEIGGADVTRREPRFRGVGYVPQEYALFPHRTVLENAMFGLLRRGVPRDEARRRAGVALERVGMSALADRRPAGLSGGEQQRAALARAIAVEPKALLLDEPLSALDDQTRDAVGRELRDVHRGSGAAAVHVCHDFTEMLVLADRAAVMRAGRIVQVAAPADLLARPRTRFVAEFVRARNILPAVARREGNGARLACAGGRTVRTAAPAEGGVEFIVRPESVAVSDAGCAPDGGALNALPGTVTDLRCLGAVTEAVIDCGGGFRLVALLSPREREAAAIAPGRPVVLSFRPADVHVLESETR